MPCYSFPEDGWEIQGMAPPHSAWPKEVVQVWGCTKHIQSLPL